MWNCVETLSTCCFRSRYFHVVIISQTPLSRLVLEMLYNLLMHSKEYSMLVRGCIVANFVVRSVANQHTLRSLARAGCGYYEFFNSKMKSRWETKIRNQLAKASQPSLSSICVEWSNFNDAEHPVQAPTEIMALFNGCRQVVYGFVPNCTQVSLCIASQI